MACDQTARPPPRQNPGHEHVGMGRATGGIRAAPKQVQRRVGWVIPPQRNADFGLAGDWQFSHMFA